LRSATTPGAPRLASKTWDFLLRNPESQAAHTTRRTRISFSRFRVCAISYAEAIRISGASAVDVSSGVELAPGVKDPALIRAFVAAARG